MATRTRRKTKRLVDPSGSCDHRSELRTVRGQRGRTEVGEGSGCRVEGGHLPDGAERPELN